MDEKMSNVKYNELVQDKCPPSKLLKNIAFAYLIGGLICVVGQLFLMMYERMGFTILQASTATSITMVFLGALLTGLNIYYKIAKVGGAGSLVPITGFANAIVSPAMEFKTEGHVFGIGSKMFVIAGPVIVFGTIASILAGFVVLILNSFIR